MLRKICGRLALLAFGTIPVIGCEAPAIEVEPPRQLLIVGIDGADPSALLRLMGQGELPHFRQLIDRGTMLAIDTAFSASPVIWTTMVTGVRPEQHGVIDFHVMTESGRSPISSASRHRPALWNMLERVGRRAAILGLWATWPAEPTRGLIVSDRIGLGLDHEVSPVERRVDLASWLAEAKSGGIAFPGSPRYVTNDRVVTIAARQALRDGSFDLVFAYFRTVDITSHAYWHLFEPGQFPAGPPPDVPVASSQNPVVDAYRAVDAALAELLANLPPKANLLVVSDHGFEAHRGGGSQLLFDFDRVLETFDLLQLSSDGSVDRERSLAWTERSPNYDWTKRIRVAPHVGPARRQELLRTLPQRLATCEFIGGGAAFESRRVEPADSRVGIDLVVRVRGESATKSVACAGRAVPNAVVHYARVTGGHGPNTRGLLLAAGPIFRHGPVAARVSIFDIAPTALYALGLPVGRDFAGTPALAIFDPSFVETHPVRTVKSWGERLPGSLVSTDKDSELLDELGALGYLQ